MKRDLLSAFLAIGLATPALSQTGVPGYVITTVAGSDSIRDGGPATSAVLAYPSAVAADKQGNIYIADMANYRFRKIDPSGRIRGLSRLHSRNREGSRTEPQPTPGQPVIPLGKDPYFTISSP